MTDRWLLIIGLVVAATGCGGGAVPRWAVEHGSVDVQSDGLEGYQVWEFFGRKWKKKRAEKHHVCSVVQDLQADLVADIDGCLACLATYQLDLSVLETDCEPDQVDTSTLGGMRYLSIGQVPSDQADQDPHPGQSMGWYLSWDGEVTEFMGFAYHEDLDTTGVAPQSGWSPSQRYLLQPAFAWEL